MIDAAFRYFLTVFVVGVVLGIVRQAVLTPTFGPAFALIIEVPFMLLASLAAAYHAMVRCRVSNVARALAMGLIAFVLLLTAELVLVMFMRRLGVRDWVSSNLEFPGIIGFVGQILFAFVPAVLSLGGGVSRLHRPRGRRHRRRPAPHHRNRDATSAR